MDLKSGIPTTRRKFDDMVKMSAYNKITTIKFENKSGVVLHTNYWMAGVDYEDKNANESEDINDDEKNSHKDDVKKY